MSKLPIEFMKRHLNWQEKNSTMGAGNYGMKNKLIGFLFIFFTLFVVPRVFNFLRSFNETPQVTDFDEWKWYGRDRKQGYSYTFYTYYLHDETRKCHLGGKETFYIMKKEKSISPDDYCEHCNMK